jgi:hypothetical protein
VARNAYVLERERYAARAARPTWSDWSRIGHTDDRTREADVPIPEVRPIALAEIRQARERIARMIVRTPLVRLELGPGQPDVRLKLENLQPYPGVEGTFVHPFDDHNFIAGHATMGLEILEDAPDTAAVIAAIGGGGLSFAKTVSGSLDGCPESSDKLELRETV